MLEHHRRVVVTGMGALTPLGHSAPALWDAMLRGESGADTISKFDPSEFETTFACEVRDFEPLDHFGRKDARKFDRFSQYGAVAGREAVLDSGILDDPDVNLDTIGVTFGSGIGGIELFQQQALVLNDQGPKRLWPFFIPMLIPDIVAGLLAIEFGFRGPNYSLVSACATGNNNIGEAFLLIRNGYADVMLCGGTEAAVCEMGVGGFNALRALSTRNDDPKGASRPFDAGRDGFVLGEGAGALVLEEKEIAEKRGATIYAELTGIGMSADAHHITAPEPEGKGAVIAMEMMLRDANLKPTDVDYINMHGTSTPLGDRAETKAVKKVFGEHAYSMNVSSTKSMTGHLLGAAGAVEAIATINAVRTNTVAPTINYETPDPECDLNCTPNVAQKREVRHAASNAFGFGGHNTSVLFSQYDG
jgi:3-oxoacyl-[acyl-carrier-protein] synthase II